MKRKKLIDLSGFSLTLIAIILISCLIQSCSDEKEQMDAWETEMASRFEAEKIELSHIKTSETVNGSAAGSENYMNINIYNSKVFAKLNQNKRLIDKKCDDVRDMIFAMPEISAYPAFDELRVNLIETRGVLIFNSKKTQTITYRVR